jgi:hypothetical protein
MTRLRQECSYKRFSKGEIGERVAAVADQRNLITKASITGIPAEVENDRRESVMKLTQAHDLSTKTVHATLHKDLPLSGSQLCDQTNL